MKTEANSVGMQTLRKHLSSGSTEMTESRVSPTKRTRESSLARRHFYIQFSLIVSNSFWYQHFETRSGNLGLKVPIFGMGCRLTNKKFITTALLMKVGWSLKIKRIRTNVPLRQIFQALKLFFAKGRGYETEDGDEIRSTQEREKGAAASDETEEEDARFSLVTHVSNVLHSFFSNVEV